MVSSHQLISATRRTRGDEFRVRYKHKQLKGLILAQNERWRRGLGMQVVRQQAPQGVLASGVRESNTRVPALRTGIAAGNCN